MKPYLFALNKQRRIAEPVNIYGNWFMLQVAFTFGVQLADGSMADYIGQCRSREAFLDLALVNNWTVLDTHELTSA